MGVAFTRSVENLHKTLLAFCEAIPDKEKRAAVSTSLTDLFDCHAAIKDQEDTRPFTMLRIGRKWLKVCQQLDSGYVSALDRLVAKLTKLVAYLKDTSNKDTPIVPIPDLQLRVVFLQNDEIDRTIRSELKVSHAHESTFRAIRRLATSCVKGDYGRRLTDLLPELNASSLVRMLLIDCIFRDLDVKKMCPWFAKCSDDDLQKVKSAVQAYFLKMREGQHPRIDTLIVSLLFRGKAMLPFEAFQTIDHVVKQVKIPEDELIAVHEYLRRFIAPTPTQHLDYSKMLSANYGECSMRLIVAVDKTNPKREEAALQLVLKLVSQNLDDAINAIAFLRRRDEALFLACLKCFVIEVAKTRFSEQGKFHIREFIASVCPHPLQAKFVDLLFRELLFTPNLDYPTAVNLSFHIVQCLENTSLYSMFIGSLAFYLVAAGNSFIPSIQESLLYGSVLDVGIRRNLLLRLAAYICGTLPPVLAMKKIHALTPLLVANKREANFFYKEAAILLAKKDQVIAKKIEWLIDKEDTKVYLDWMIHSPLPDDLQAPVRDLVDLVLQGKDIFFFFERYSLRQQCRILDAYFQEVFVHNRLPAPKAYELLEALKKNANYQLFLGCFFFWQNDPHILEKITNGTIRRNVLSRLVAYLSNTIPSHEMLARVDVLNNLVQNEAESIFLYKEAAYRLYSINPQASMFCLEHIRDGDAPESDAAEIYVDWLTKLPLEQKERLPRETPDQRTARDEDEVEILAQQAAHMQIRPSHEAKEN